jgi:hypothetical protein
MDAHHKVVSADTDPFEDRLIEIWEKFSAECGRSLAKLPTK